MGEWKRIFGIFFFFLAFWHFCFVTFLYSLSCNLLKLFIGSERQLWIRRKTRKKGKYIICLCLSAICCFVARKEKWKSWKEKKKTMVVFMLVSYCSMNPVSQTYVFLFFTSLILILLWLSKFARLTFFWGVCVVFEKLTIRSDYAMDYVTSLMLF